MPPKRSSTEIEDTIIKQGCLIKSPPAYIFSKRASWKGRLFKLCKTPVDSYFIRYYAYDGVTEEWKGNIAVSEIKSIDIGTNAMDRIMTITRLFNNSPENVLCIKTNRRDYYLVDDKKNIEDWQRCITDIWVTINQKENVDGPQILHPGPVACELEATLARLPTELRGLAVYPVQSRQAAVQHVRSQIYENQAVVMDEATRPKSYPVEHPRSESALVDTQDRKRANTDSETPRRNSKTLSKLPELPSELFQHLELSAFALERNRSKTYSNAEPSCNTEKNNFRRVSLPEQNYKNDSRRLSEDTAYNSDSESIYDIPRSLLRKKDSTDSDEESSDIDCPDEHVYQPMWPLQQDSYSGKNITDPDQLPNDSKELIENLRAQEKNDSLPRKLPQNPQFADIQRHKKQAGSQLKKAYILKMMYEQDSMDYVMKSLTIPTAHLQKHLGLQEVGDRLCVSKWKGPADIGCVFCHGDHIDEVNGFRPENKDFFFQMLNRSTKEEVNLVVRRNTKAGVFHVDGCNCGGS